MPASTDPLDPTAPLSVPAYVCPSEKAPFALTTVTLPPLSATMVQADVQMIGLCHTDIHMRDNDWGVSNYPFCAGHEGVAVVTRVGDAVRTLNVGDRVAIAWIRDSCRACDKCMEGRENLCQDGYQGLFLGASAGVWGKSNLNYNQHGGCFAKTQRIEERFAIKIPQGVPSEIACPLLCGGGTVYEPLCDYAYPNAKVGVAGIGGLGTAAIKLGKLRGCIMVALSTSPHKKEAALGAGANAFVHVNNHDEMEKAKATLDVIIDTSPAISDLKKFMPLLKFDGVYVRTGIPKASEQAFAYDYIPLVFCQQKIVGTVVTGSRRMKDMLHLVEHNLDFMLDKGHWKTEHVKIDKINEAMDNLLNRKNKGYRYVLEW